MNHADSDAPVVILVGHCGPDRALLRNAVLRHLSGSASSPQVVAAGSDGELAAALRPGAVLLVNRVLDGDFASESGVDIIRQVANGPVAVESILISNHADAQAAAVEAGARPGAGFGKAALFAQSTGEILRSAAFGRPHAS
jgi:hypothetical protein